MQMRRRGTVLWISAAVVLLAARPATADEVLVEMNMIDASGIGAEVGTITLRDSDNGLLIDLDLTDAIPAGPHGTHIHENPSCAPALRDGTPVAGLAAGGHYDPGNTGKHLGPSGDGHLGDLPVVYVESDGGKPLPTTHTLVAPRLTVADVRGRSLVIHSGGDNYRDEPKPLGGGGSRIACGLIPG